MMKLVLMRKTVSGEVVLAREEVGDGGIAQTSPDKGRAMYLSLVQHLVPSSGLQLHFCLLIDHKSWNDYETVILKLVT